ncbi:MAG: hypothetical protein K1X67_08100 [Fimbriimonadaceae bacterium]|nr:hypothetical protein [Fimbriimonadaceae bacterium]
MPIVINVATQADLGVFKDLVKALGQAKQATAGFAQATGPYTGGSGRGSKPPQVGPTQMDLFKYFDGMNKATKGGFQSQRDDALRRAFLGAQQRFLQSGDPAALRQMNALSGQVAKLGQGSGGLGQAIQRAIMSTRFGVGGGGGVQPLIGQVANVLGKAGPIGMAVTAGAAVIGTFVGSVQKASESINQFTDGMLSAQTTATTYARISGLGALVGGDPASVARNVINQARNDPWAAQQAMRSGINPFMPDWTQDYGDAFERIARSFQGLSMRDAQLKANQMGSPELAKLAFATPSDVALIKRAMQPLTGKQMQEAAQFSLHAAAAQMSLNRTFDELAGMFLPAATSALKDFTGALSGITKWVAEHESGVRGALGPAAGGEKGWEAIKGYGGIGGNKIWDWIFGPDGKPEKKSSSASNDLRDNTEELRKLNANMRENGIYGGGGRAQRAIPRRARNGHYLNERALREAMQGGLL